MDRGSPIFRKDKSFASRPMQDTSQAVVRVNNNVIFTLDKTIVYSHKDTVLHGDCRLRCRFLHRNCGTTAKYTFPSLLCLEPNNKNTALKEYTYTLPHEPYVSKCISFSVHISSQGSLLVCERVSYSDQIACISRKVKLPRRYLLYFISKTCNEVGLPRLQKERSLL